MTNATSTELIQPLTALARAAACFDLAVEPSQLAHQLGLTPDKIDSIALCRCAGWIVVYAPERCINNLSDWAIWRCLSCSVMARSGMYCWR